MARLVITIDGPAGSGKSTAAKLLAERIDADFLDTGAMYRAVTLAGLQADIDMNNKQQLLDILNNTNFEFSVENNEMTVFINGVNVTERIRLPEVTENAHYVASAPALREKLVSMQRDFAADHEKIVTEGRDQGTVAFPDADMKFFLIADINERAKRRQAQLLEQGQKVDIEQIINDIKRRDKSDEERNVGPLKPAENAVVVDTTDLTIEQVVDKLMWCVKNDV